ncbi:DNA-binding response regulator [Saccharibacillus sp. O23]|uniref:response regulator transcription factor n=1 Tax=Saccharibacillus sp. O23 TaxID=2009338 RepID=UPI000B4E6BE1|nr:response regulator transcription factor [Saccharibacillus sp. O23]OWR27179.1 DNA-binding response regulator [Saccharibacillus sp. O23]
MAKVIVADDDPHIAELVRLILQQQGLQVRTAADGLQALRLMNEDPADMVILDIMMPEMDGWALCRELRRDHDIPLLILTAKGETGDKVKGFELGTDDYLVKPFEPAELEVRVKALLKRYQIASSQQVTAAELFMDKRNFGALVHGRPVNLPPKEYELLFLLAGNMGRTLTRDHLIEKVWGYDYEGNERTLDVHVNRLRERFDEWQAGLRISTVRGLGYRLESVR